MDSLCGNNKEKRLSFECDLEIQHILSGSSDETINGLFRIDGNENVVDVDLIEREIEKFFFEHFQMTTPELPAISL